MRESRLVGLLIPAVRNAQRETREILLGKGLRSPFPEVVLAHVSLPFCSIPFLGVTSSPVNLRPSPPHPPPARYTHHLQPRPRHRRYSGWFVHFRPGGAVGLPNGSYYSPPCTAAKCSPLFHSQDQTPSHTLGRKECVDADCDCGPVPCGEYIWDHRNASLREWLVNTHVLGPDGLGNPNVSGFYFDDAWRGVGFPFTAPGAPFNASDCRTGPSEIEQHCLHDMGLSAGDVAAITDGWRQTMREVLMAVIEGGGWAWPMFTGYNIRRDDPDYCKRLCVLHV